MQIDITTLDNKSLSAIKEQKANELMEDCATTFEERLKEIVNTSFNWTDLKVIAGYFSMDREFIINEANPKKSEFGKYFPRMTVAIEYITDDRKPTTFGTDVSFDLVETYAPCGSSWGSANTKDNEYDYNVRMLKNALPFVIQQCIPSIIRVHEDGLIEELHQIETALRKED